MDNNEIVPVNNLTALTASTPAEMIKKASMYASALGKVIVERGLSTRIGDKEHVNIEGWSTLGTLLGVMPHIEWTRRCEGKDVDDVAFEARAVLKTMSGEIVGAAENMAAMSENKPWSKNLFSVRSMAETRAVGKAYRLNFAWIMKLAGYEGTPAEEMPVEVEQKPVTDIHAKASIEQVKKIFAVAKSHNIATPEFVKEWIKNKFNLESFNDLTVREASLIIEDMDVPFGDPAILVDWRKEQAAEDSKDAKEKVASKIEEYKSRGKKITPEDLVTPEEALEVLSS